MAERNQGDILTRFLQITEESGKTEESLLYRLIDEVEISAENAHLVLEKMEEEMAQSALEREELKYEIEKIKKTISEIKESGLFSPGEIRRARETIQNLYTKEKQKSRKRLKQIELLKTELSQGENLISNPRIQIIDTLTIQIRDLSIQQQHLQTLITKTKELKDQTQKLAEVEKRLEEQENTYKTLFLEFDLIFSIRAKIEELFETFDIQTFKEHLK